MIYCGLEVALVIALVAGFKYCRDCGRRICDCIKELKKKKRQESFIKKYAYKN